MAITESFFSGVDQTEITVEGVKAKVPVFYRDARFFGGVFLAPAQKLRKLIPDERFTPAQMFPGLCPVQIQACEYHDTDVGVYNEFNVHHPSQCAGSSQGIRLQLLEADIRKTYDVYYHKVIVNNENSSSGLDFGFPELRASIEFKDTPDWVTCEVKEGGDLVCHLRGRKLLTNKNDFMKFFCHQRINSEMVTAEMRINFPRYAMSFKPGGIELTLGQSHPLAVELSNLLVSTRAIGYTYAPCSNSSFSPHPPPDTNESIEKEKAGQRLKGK